MDQCARCKRKIGLFTSVKLYSGEKICKTCYRMLPLAFQKYRYLDYDFFLQGYQYAQTVLERAAPQFLVTSQYGRMALDEKHGLVYFGDATDFTRDGHLKKRTVNIYHCMALSNVEIQVEPGEVHAEAKTVECRVTFSASFQGSEVRILETLKRHAKGRLFINPGERSVSCAEPSDLVAFRNVYNQMVKRTATGIEEVERALEKKRREEEWMASVQEQIKQELREKMEHELEQERQKVQTGQRFAEAKALFMLEEPYDIQQLKQQRALLLKTFHPDNGRVDSAAYAQKINDAFQTLLAYARSE